MRDYEITFILSTTLDEEAQAATVERVNTLIVNGEGSVTEVHAWGRRHLAYPIEHQRDGFYITTRFSMPPAGLGVLENDLRLSESILRHLIVRQDEVPVLPTPLSMTTSSAAAPEAVAAPSLDAADEDDALVEDIDPELIPAAED